MSKASIPPTAPLVFIKDSKSTFQGLIAIPVCDESVTLPEVIASLEKNAPELIPKVLLIINVNNRIGADSTDNQKIIAWLKSYQGPLNLAYLNSTEEPYAYPQKFGVGLARHQAVNSGLGYLKDKSPVICLDGDSPVNNTYLEVIFKYLENNPGFGAGHVDFEHRVEGSDEEKRAIQLYDRHLRLHRDRLKKAGCPHAWYAIGSTIVCTKEAYLKCGGFSPRRMAGEDFYILQRLSKVGYSIEMIHGARVLPSNRQSKRVPFGTGKAVIDILRTGDWYTYHPQCYELLGALLKSVYNNLEADGALVLSLMPEPAKNWLMAKDFTKVWDKLRRNSKTQQTLKQRFDEWLDAFRTLKFIHYLTETHFPKVKMNLPNSPPSTNFKP